MADTLSTPLMTRYEYNRMLQLEASGMSHDAAKAQIYGERGPSGAPVTGDAGSASAAPASVAPDASVAATEPTGTIKLGTLLALGAAGLVVYFLVMRKKVKDIPLVGDVINETAMQTGILSAPKKRKRRRK